MRIFLCSAAMLALASTAALAEPGKGNGNGGNRGGERGEARGPDRAAKPDRGEARAERRQDNREERGERRVERREDVRDIRQERRDDRREDRREAVRIDRDQRAGSIVREVRYENRDGRDSWRFDRERGLLDGCPPGLAKKRNGCLPPGLARQGGDRYDDDLRLFRYDWQPRFFGLSAYDPGRYFYRDGYLLRIGSGGGISGYIPLLGGALAIGNPWPVDYRSYELPPYYVDYYDLGSYDRYRYADNVVYRVDAEDAAIMAVAALLTGDEFAVGRPLPVGYDVYNVPYAYRDRYYDTPDAMYRYSDGYIYQVDPETQLIAAAIDLIV
mgnify:CR=1 FL=1